MDCRDGLSTRPGAASDEIQLRIDPMDLDDELTGLHTQVRRLKNVRFHHFYCVFFFFLCVYAILSGCDFVA